MTKRLLALLLCLVMLASLFPAAAFAEGSIAEAEEDAGAEAPGGPEDDGAPVGGWRIRKAWCCAAPTGIPDASISAWWSPRRSWSR